MATDSDDLFTVKLSFVIRAGAVSVVVALVLTGIYYWATRSVKDTVVFFAAIVAAIGAVLSAFYAARAITLSTRAQNAASAAAQAEFLRQRHLTSMRYGERWNHPNMFHVRDTVREVFSASVGRQGEEAFNKIIEEKKTNVIHFLNFLEEVAIVLDRDLADHDIMFAQFQGILGQGYHRLEPWIVQHRRERGLPRMWEYAEMLAAKWDGGEKAAGRA